jgi:hypothetical protein
MNLQQKLAAELTVVWGDIKSRIDKKMLQIESIFGRAGFEHMFKDIDSRQRTQTCTKLFQYLVTQAIVEVCEENDIPLKSVDKTGHDWVYEGLHVEQKVKTMLTNYDSYSKYNVKKYGVVNTSWTGNKATVTNNKKADTHLLLVFAIDGSKVKSSMATLISLKRTGSKWVTGTGQSDSYSTLTINKHTDGSNIIYGDYHSTPKNFYGLLQESN